MMRSLYSGVSGLRNHQTRMDVIGNNIANVNTTGYKTSRTVFQDIYSQTVKSASAGSATLGGINPSQIGLGVRLAAIDMIFTSGAAQITDNPSDLSIDGDGLFVVDTNGTEVGGLAYTRAGNFYLDNQGNLVTSDGYFVMGFKLATGTRSTVMVQARDESNELMWVMDADGNYVQATDAGGAPLWVTNEAGDKYILVDDNDDTITKEVDILTYDPTDSANAGFSLIPQKVPVMVEELQIDYTLLAVPENPTRADLTFINLADYVNVAFDSKGIVWGIDAAGQKVAVAQVALAMFTNNSGLEKIGGSLYDYTPSSGNPVFTVANQKGAGKINPSALEMSNVDLAQEFTDMIITQRGFQANSRVITTSDSMLEELVNLKR